MVALDFDACIALRMKRYDMDNKEAEIKALAVEIANSVGVMMFGKKGSNKPGAANPRESLVQ